MEFIKDTHIDFIGKTRYAVPASIILVLLALGMLRTPGLSYGVEFSGGTQLVVKFQQTPEADRVRDAIARVAPGAVVQSYDEPSRNEMLIRIAESGGEGAGASDEALSALADAVLAALGTSYADNPVLESSSEIVGPIVGVELRRKAVQLVVLALLFQLIYIGFRFNGPVWGSAAALAVIHDVIITLGILALTRYEITLNTIAALLTLVGYSVNDTIVVFDRARENLHQRRREPLRDTLNTALNQTLSRTLITSGTTLAAVLGLYLFGGEVLRGFAFTMVVGVIVGTYSTIYVASPLVIWWRGRSGRGDAPAARAAL
jgi:preprotein translocase subunit SecF